MTTFLRYAHLSLVAYPALAIILLLAFRRRGAEALRRKARTGGARSS